VCQDQGSLFQQSCVKFFGDSVVSCSQLIWLLRLSYPHCLPLRLVGRSNMMAQIGHVVGAVSAAEIAFQAELNRRSSVPALAAENFNYQSGSRRLQVLIEEIVSLTPTDPSGNLLLRAAVTNLLDQDVAHTMLSGWKAFARAAAPVGHPDPTSCVMCRRLWSALTRTIVILESGGGQVLQAAGVGPLDPLLPLKHAQAGERMEEEELDRLSSGTGAPGGQWQLFDSGVSFVEWKGWEGELQYGAG
jgi:hypothetical protein